MGAGAEGRRYGWKEPEKRATVSNEINRRRDAAQTGTLYQSYANSFTSRLTTTRTSLGRLHHFTGIKIDLGTYLTSIKLTSQQPTRLASRRKKN